MKKSHLTLAILTAVLVSACGGSSSNDDATKDHGKPITPSKTTPTTPTKTTPTTPTTNDNSAKKPSTPTASTPNNSTPSTPTKTTTPTPTETTPKKTTTTTLTPEQIVLAETNKKTEAEKKIKETLKPASDTANEELDKKEKELKAKSEDTKNPLSPEEKQKLEDQIVAAKLVALEKYNAVLEEGKKVAESDLKIAQNSGHDTVQFEKNVAEANASLELQQATKAYTEAQQAQTLADRAVATENQLVKAYSDKLQELIADDKQSGLTEQNKELVKNYKKTQEEYKKALTPPEKESGKEENKEEKTKEIAEKKEAFEKAKIALEEGNKDLKDLSTKVTEAKKKAEEAQTKADTLDSIKALKNLEEKQAALSALESFNGVRFSDAENDTFGEVRSVSYDEGKGKWSITFTGAEGAKDDKVEVAKSSDDSAKYGTFTAAKEGSPAQGVKATAYSAYGYVGDKFFSVGKLISLKDYVLKETKAAATTGEDAAPKKQELKYQGTAFVNATVKGKDKPQAQVADFEAKATFGDSNTLEGSFSNFQSYDSNETAFKNLSQKTGTVAENEKVKFTSTINPEDSSFVTADDKADVKVQGFFYQAEKESSAVGGLVDSKKEGHVFKGAFGGEQVTQPATTQPATTQPATTQPATTQPATTQTAGQ